MTKEKATQNHVLEGISLNDTTVVEMRKLADQLGLKARDLSPERLKMELQYIQVKETKMFPHVDANDIVKKVVVRPNSPMEMQAPSIRIGVLNPNTSRLQAFFIPLNREWGLPIRAIRVLEDLTYMDNSTLKKDEATGTILERTNINLHQRPAYNVQVLGDFTIEELEKAQAITDRFGA